MHSRSTSRFLAGALAVAAVIGLAACGASPADERNTGHGARITVGAQGSLENRIIAQAYGQALADHGYLVDYNEGVGGRTQYIEALQTGRIDLIPETSGALLYGVDNSAFARSADDIEDELPDAVEELKLHVLEPAPADNAVAFVVTEEFAEQRQVASIGELAYLADEITIGASDGFDNETYGPAGLLGRYGVTGFDTRTISDNGGISTVGDLLTNSVQVAVIPSTSPAIIRNGLRVLNDPKSLITAQNIVPFVNAQGYTADVQEIVNAVSERLTTDELRELNEQGTASTTPSPETIAHAWLSAKGLVRD
jgi:osmoprotectant transport system substrate-binding protein